MGLLDGLFFLHHLFIILIPQALLYHRSCFWVEKPIFGARLIGEEKKRFSLGSLVLYDLEVLLLPSWSVGCVPDGLDS